MTKSKAPLNEEALKKELRETVADIRRTADEIRLKIHLARMDAKDAWVRLEPRVHELEKRVEDATDATIDELKKLGADLRGHLESIRTRVTG
jgi:hypothetical protein